MNTESIYRTALGAALALALALACFGQTRLYYDYAWQLMSVRDHTRGDTTSAFVMRSADRADLTRDRTEWTIGYPLGYNVAGLGLTSLGLSAAAAHRVIGALAVLLGILGWHYVLTKCTSLAPGSRAVALLALSVSLNGVGMLGFMMPEVFMFATVPWQMWALWHATAAEISPRQRLWFCAVLGAVTGIAYTFRYLTVFHGLPLLAFVALWLLAKRPARWLSAGFLLAGTAAFPVGLMSLANYLSIGAINSTSESLPWGVSHHWPTLTQWLLVMTGPMQALLGSTIVFDRSGTWLGEHVFGMSGYHAIKLLQVSLPLIPTLIAAALLARFAPRDRLLGGALAGVAGTIIGLLIIYGTSGLPQPDARYSVGSAMLLWPALVAAGYAAWQHSARWRIPAVVVALPPLAALAFAGRAHQLALFSDRPTGPGRIIADGGVDVDQLRAEVRRQLPPDSGEVIWMCFQPGVLYALDERHVFESYEQKVVDYRASRPVTIVVLRDRSLIMHPSTYEDNHLRLDIPGHAPEFVHGNYDVFIRRVGPDGVIGRSSDRS